MRRAVVSLLGSVLITIVSCKEDPQRPPAARDLGQAPPLGGGIAGGSDAGNPESGAGEGGVTDAGGDGGACAIIANDGVIVVQEGVVGDAPTGTGGTIADGDYELTVAQVYVGLTGTPGPTGQQVQGAIRINAGKFERAHRQGAVGNPQTESRLSGLFTTNGSTLTWTATCPFMFQDQTTYSVVGNTLVFTMLGTRESFTFTLQ